MEYYNELTHWGVRGMKWGVRRYQNKDGSLTPAGKKRRAKLEGELEKLGGTKKDTDGAPRKKSISEMSNKELQEHTTRMQLEKNYYDAQRQLVAANPKPVSKGRQIAEEFINKAVIPATTNAGKAYIEKMMKEKMGIDTEDPVSKLEKTWKKLDYEQKIDKIKNPDKYMTWDDKTKQYDLERKQKSHAEEDAAKAKDEADKAAADAAAAKAHKVSAQKEEQARAGSGSSVNAFVNKVTETHVSRSPFKDTLADSIDLNSKEVSSGKAYVDEFFKRDDD